MKECFQMLYPCTT